MIIVLDYYFLPYNIKTDIVETTQSRTLHGGSISAPNRTIGTLYNIEVGTGSFQVSSSVSDKIFEGDTLTILLTPITQSVQEIKFKHRHLNNDEHEFIDENNNQGLLIATIIFSVLILIRRIDLITRHAFFVFQIVMSISLLVCLYLSFFSNKIF